jgi:hypothetical protein
MKKYLLRKKAIISRMFFCFGIYLFDARRKESGGFNHFIAGRIFKWKYDFLIISIEKQWKFNKIYQDDNFYYDGYLNSINIGCLHIYYGT